MPKKLSETELEQLNIGAVGKKHLVRVAIENMQPGEHILITRKEFKWRRRTPYFFCLALSKNTKRRYTISRLIDNSGWVVTRVE